MNPCTDPTNPNFKRIEFLAQQKDRVAGYLFTRADGDGYFEGAPEDLRRLTVEEWEEVVQLFENKFPSFLWEHLYDCVFEVLTGWVYTKGIK